MNTKIFGFFSTLYLARGVEGREGKVRERKKREREREREREHYHAPLFSLPPLCSVFWGPPASVLGFGPERGQERERERPRERETGQKRERERLKKRERERERPKEREREKIRGPYGGRGRERRTC